MVWRVAYFTARLEWTLDRSLEVIFTNRTSCCACIGRGFKSTARHLRKVSLTCSPGRPKPCEGIWVVSWVADETQDWAIVWPPHELWALCQTAHSMWNLQIQVRRTKWQFWEFQTIDTIPLTIRVNIRTDFIPPAIDNKANVATLFRRFQQNVNLLRHVTKKNFMIAAYLYKINIWLYCFFNAFSYTK